MPVDNRKRQQILFTSWEAASYHTPMTPAQCRAARGLIDWTQTRLAEAAGISLSTVRDFETGKRRPIRANVLAITSAFEAAGVMLLSEEGTSGAGVRWTNRGADNLPLSRNS